MPMKIEAGTIYNAEKDDLLYTQAEYDAAVKAAKVEAYKDALVKLDRYTYLGTSPWEEIQSMIKELENG